jgi:hypothetical protein
MKELIKNFELINDQFKVPVFVELNKDAINIWKRFVSLMVSLRKPSRDEIIQIRYEMEQYMIGISQEQVKKAQLENTLGIWFLSKCDTVLRCAS